MPNDNPQTTGKTYSIGFMREDGDFQLLATLNNHDNLIEETRFDEMRDALVEAFVEKCEPTQNIIWKEREDAPDYINIEE